VPANVPITLYWSATAYDRATHTSSETRPGPADPRTHPVLRPTTTDQWLCSSPPNRPTDARATGSPHERTVNSKSFAASTGQRKLSSTRRGDGLPSNGCPEPSDPTDSHGRRSRGRVL